MTDRYQVDSYVSSKYAIIYYIDRILTIPYFMSAFVTPLFGFIVDLIGNR